MKEVAKNRKLGKTTAQRKAMLRTQVTDLLVNEKITTTIIIHITDSLNIFFTILF